MAIPVGILDLIFIQSIPRRQEFRAIKHLLSFGGLAVRNAKGEPITADYAVVQTIRSHPQSPILNETSFSQTRERSFPPRSGTVGLAAHPLVSELFRIIIFVSERHPRGSKLKLSFLAIAGRRATQTRTGRTCVLNDGGEEVRRKKPARTCTEQRRRQERSSRDLPAGLVTVFCSREPSFPSPALSSCFSARPTPKSARLNLPWNFGELPLAMQKTTVGLGRSSCCSCVPRSEMSILPRVASPTVLSIGWLCFSLNFRADVRDTPTRILISFSAERYALLLKAFPALIVVRVER